MKKLLLSAIIIAYTTTISIAQVLEPVSWKFTSKQLDEQHWELIFTASIEKGWHMYGLNIPPNGPVPTSFMFEENKGISYTNTVSPTSKPDVKFDPTFEMDVELFADKVVFKRKLKIEEAGTYTIAGSVEYMVCDDSRCLPPTEEDFEFTIKQKKPTATAAVEEGIKSVKEDSPKTSSVSTSIITQNENPGDGLITQAEVEVDIEAEGESVSVTMETEPTAPATPTDDTSLIRLFFLALLAGFGALLTPCVYPIIPLTVSFFMRDTSRSKAIYNGLFFGLSIVFIYTLVGFIVGIFKVDLVRLIGSHWIPNLIFLLIFLALAFSFFGMFEITLPGSLSNKIDQQADKGGFLGPFFMALATVVISFSCTGPIVGVVLGSALQGELIKPIVGMLGFSISFALPFTLLAIFPGFMKKLPKSGGWLNAVKVFFAFILLAFSLMFLSNLGLPFISRSVVISLAIVIFVLLGFYLLGRIRFSHDSPVDYVSVPRIMLAIISFAIAVYMVPGLFGAPLKTISPFLPAKDESSFDLSKMLTTSQVNVIESETSPTICTNSPKYADFLHLPHGLKGYFDYDEALACAKELNKPVLLDFAGHSCKNCKKMYAEVWSDPRVLTMLRNDFVIVVLYTDDRTKLEESEWVTSSIDGKVKKTIGKKFNDLQITKFGSNALPLYAIVDANGNIITDKEYHTYSPDIESFLAFLEDGLEDY